MRWAWLLVPVLFALTAPSAVFSGEKVTCPDGDHYIIDVREIAIKYQATHVEGTVNGLAVVGFRIAVDQKTLQTAAVGTQRMNEFVKALVIGYNSCAISRQQYQQAVNRLIPDIEGDARQLEAFRRQILNRQQINTKRLNRVIAHFELALRKFAAISGKQLMYDQIVAVVEAQTLPLKEKMEEFESLLNLIPIVVSRLDALERRNTAQPVATPAAVAFQLGQLLPSEAHHAEAAYQQGYDSFQRYQFSKAIPYLEEALQTTKLPEFYVTLDRAYLELSDLSNAERIAREGIDYATKMRDHASEATLSSLLGRSLQAKGDLDGALKFTEQALSINTKLFGVEHRIVASDFTTIGQILKDKGDLDGALKSTEQALSINTKLFGVEHPIAATDFTTIGQILKDKGDLDGALKSTEQALSINTKLFGVEHPIAATAPSTTPQILNGKGHVDAVGATPREQQ